MQKEVCNRRLDQNTCTTQINADRDLLSNPSAIGRRRRASAFGLFTAYSTSSCVYTVDKDRSIFFQCYLGELFITSLALELFFSIVTCRKPWSMKTRRAFHYQCALISLSLSSISENILPGPLGIKMTKFRIVWSQNPLELETSPYRQKLLDNWPEVELAYQL